MLAMNLDIGWEFDLVVVLPIFVVIIAICIWMVNRMDEGL